VINISSIIDHTLLKANASRKDIENLCREAVEYEFCSVCVNPVNVGIAVQSLKGSQVKVCTVVGFPLGANLAGVKAYEAGKALEQGALEVDMVINIGAVKSGDYDIVVKEIKAVKKVAGDRIVKVILETCYLTDDEKTKLGRLAVDCGANFVKTSTGFGTGGATTADVRLLREVVGPDVGIKASGGIRDLKTLMEIVDAGANRIGASSGVKIMKELKEMGGK